LLLPVPPFLTDDAAAEMSRKTTDNERDRQAWHPESMCYTSHEYTQQNALDRHWACSHNLRTTGAETRTSTGDKSYSRAWFDVTDLTHINHHAVE